MANIFNSSNPPIKNTAFTFDCVLFDTSGKVKTSPTLAAGDVQVSKDGGAFANITDLPVQIGSTGVLKVSLTATEMNADRVAIKFHDAAGDEWADLLVTFSTVQVVAMTDPLDIWAHVPRTLTQTAAQIDDALMGDMITITRDATLHVSLTGLGSLAGRTRLYFTVKGSMELADTASLVQIEETDGLIYINSQEAEDNNLGEIIVVDESAGNVNITLEAGATARLPIVSALAYDIKMLIGTEAVEMATGVARIQSIPTRALD